MKNDLGSGDMAVNTGDMNVVGGQDLAVQDAFIVPDGAPDGGIGNLVVPSAVVFGNAGCGGASPEPQTINLSNNGTIALSFSATIDNTQFAFGTLPAGWAVDGTGTLTGTLAVGEQETLQLTSAAVLATATAGVDVTGNLDVTADDQRKSPWLPIHGFPFPVTPFARDRRSHPQHHCPPISFSGRSRRHRRLPRPTAPSPSPIPGMTSSPSRSAPPTIRNMSPRSQAAPCSIRRPRRCR